MFFPKWIEEIKIIKSLEPPVRLQCSASFLGLARAGDLTGLLAHFRDHSMTERLQAKSAVIKRIMGGSLPCCYSRAQEQRIWGTTECTHSFKVAQRIIWPIAHHSKFCPPDNRTVWSHRVGLSLNWLLCQENNFFFSCYYLVFVLTWKRYTVSSGWARGLFSVCQATLMMGIKSQGTASQLDRKPSHRVLVGLGFFSSTPKWKNPGMGHSLMKIYSAWKKKKKIRRG